MHHARKRERRARFLELEVRLEEGQGVVGVDQGVDLCVVDLEDGVGQGAGVSRKVGDRDDSIERDYEDEKDRKVTGNTNQFKFGIRIWHIRRSCINEMSQSPSTNTPLLIVPPPPPNTPASNQLY
jgi:hypothetical protein